jgi:hypothetical protein
VHKSVQILKHLRFQSFGSEMFNLLLDQGCSSVVEGLPGMEEALGSVSSTLKKSKLSSQIQVSVLQPATYGK